MKKFRFVSNQNSTINGINDAGIETFTANIKRSLVRENLQNALDAVIPNSKEPVRVEFSLFNIPADQVPDIATLRDVVDKCISSNHDEPEAVKFFTRAKNILSGSTVPVLRISDFNTVGLGGSDTCSKGTNWSRLVKESGSSNKGTNSGGVAGAIFGGVHGTINATADVVNRAVTHDIERNYQRDLRPSASI